MTHPIVRWSGIVAIVVVVAIQFIPVDRDNPPVQSGDPASDEVTSILRRACYDCHSNETVWPWYSRIAPLSWLVASDVHEGRAALNFSAWSLLTPAKQRELLADIWEEVEEREMPPRIYLVSHSEARLSVDDLAVIRTWAFTEGGRHE